MRAIARTEKFKSINIDIEKGIYEVNGRDISESANKLELSFSNGTWSLIVSEDTIYTTDKIDKNVTTSRKVVGPGIVLEVNKWI